MFPDTLNLSCVGYTRNDIAHIARSCQTLKHLALFNTGASDALCEVFATECPSLTSLKLGGLDMDAFTDAGVQALTQSTSLVTLDLSYAPHLTPAALEAFLAMPSLRKVKLFGCGITKDALDGFIARGLKKGLRTLV